MTENTLFPNSPDSWREQAMKEYRQRRQDLIDSIQQISEMISDLQKRASNIASQVRDLDHAAAVFGLPTPEKHELRLETKVAPQSRSGRLFKDVTLDLLKQAYPKPMKAAKVRRDAEKIMGETFHPKTAGMTLYRLSQDGLVRREGHQWFYVPEEKRSGIEEPSSSSQNNGGNDA